MIFSSQNNYHSKSAMLYCGDSSEVFAEISKICLMIDPDFDISTMGKVHRDLIKLFQGDYPGFCASNTKYHNLEHTNAVALALVRLTHGMHLSGSVFSRRTLGLGVFSAFFHDVGLLPAEDDHVGTGAKYMIGHEQRSIHIMEEYLRHLDNSERDSEDCARMIDCTILNISPREVHFKSEEIQRMGFILGTADLLAQMADRCYLEKLPLLYMEFKEGGIPGYESSFDLFKKTEDFYRLVAMKRMAEDLGNVARFMMGHFKSRWGIDEDLYATSISNQMHYLKVLTDTCEDNYPCLLANLKRKF